MAFRPLHARFLILLSIAIIVLLGLLQFGNLNQTRMLFIAISLVMLGLVLLMLIRPAHGRQSTSDGRTHERYADMGRAVSGLVHEIRNALFGITSIAQIFERELARPAHRELAAALLSETRRINRVVEEVLLYTRPAKLSLEPCDLGALWEAAIAACRHELSQKELVIETDFGWPRCTARLDDSQMKQVFQNLLLNAIETSPSGGRICIDVKNEADGVMFSVRDTGAGIPVENRAHVFDLFYSTKSRGSGLGLPICKKIVEDHGGRIAIVSRNENDGAPGTTVTVTLPGSATAGAGA